MHATVCFDSIPVSLSTSVSVEFVDGGLKYGLRLETRFESSGVLAVRSMWCVGLVLSHLRNSTMAPICISLTGFALARGSLTRSGRDVISHAWTHITFY